MDLPNLFTQAKQAGFSKKMLCVILTDTAVQALLLEVDSDQSKILEQSSLERYSDTPTCVIKVDEVLQQLGPESESINEAVFCVPHSWLDESQIVPGKKPLLQKIITDLSLKPGGFLVQTEVISDYLVAGNAHISVVVSLIDEHHVSLVILGKGTVQAVHTVGRSGDVASDIQEALARFLQEAGEAYLPAKVICASFVLPEEQLHEIQQTLLSSEWEKSLPFVQKPTVDSIPPAFFLKVIAQQVGKALFSGSTRSTSDEKGSHNHSFGVPLAAQTATPFASSDLEEVPTEMQEEIGIGDHTEKAAGFSGVFKGPSGKFTLPHVTKSVLIGFAAGVSTLLIAVLAWIFFLAPVVVTVVAEERMLAKDVLLTLDPQATVADVENLRIPGKKISKEFAKTSSTHTTGVKIIGEPAKGEVLLVNKTKAEKKFAAGTQLSFGELTFTLDAETTVPAAVEKDIVTTENGQAKAQVTARAIGAEGNLTKDSKLTVASYDVSTYIAQVTADFAGGTSREVKVVGQADKDLLISELKKEVLTEANKGFSADATVGTYVLPAKDVLMTKTVFSHEKDAVTDELAVEVVATVTTLSYTSEALLPVAKAVLADQLPAGYALTDDPPQILSAPKGDTTDKKSPNVVVISANLTAAARAQLDPDRIKEKIAGQPKAQVPELLRSEHVSSVQIQYVPAPLTAMLSSLPKAMGRIRVQQAYPD